MITDYLDVIISLPLFQTFTRDALRSWLNLYNYSIAEFPPGSTIFNEGEECRSIFVILSGTVMIQKIDSSGRYFNVGEAAVGEIMGSNVMFSDHTFYPLSTTAITNVKLLSLPRELVIKLCQVNVHFLESLLRISSGKAFLLTKRLNEVTVQTLKQNIARFLLKEADAQDTALITLPFTKKEWADLLGVQRPSLQRELKRLEELECIIVRRDQIQLLDKELLQRLADE
ncbi:Crp/Fnr family transcriptional regulator [Proteiniclasticum sp. QWL-01]|uniref:Crp/Fnr family transcriptional regulator n=1 Tax=Proteiniclasticum sp. QWL-01 TaxID=3036945 RepID=UPI00240EEA9D|nr:Crp/Fnr family transcriptional regulator [Proteiniclasticum sp. QWL-01]WFF72567.1 Crp/Fnr family transcriptional regulator [Proteiniclasticum sp. QWL-01]